MMNSALKTAAIATFALFVFCQVPTFAQDVLSATPAPLAAKAAHKKGDRVEGTVTAIDPASGTITIHERKLNTDIVATVTAATKYVRSTDVGIAGLAVGDRIMAQGKGDLAPGATTIAADRISVVSPLTPARKHLNARSVEGTIATVTPTLTINTDEGTAISVATDPTTRVVALQPAALTDVTVGQHVQAVGKLTNGTYVASQIQIAPARAGNGRKKKTQAI